MLQCLRTAFGILEHKFHVGLTAGKPYLPHCHVRIDQLILCASDLQRHPGPRCQRRQIDTPCAVPADAAGNRAVLRRKRNPYRFASGSCSKNCNVLVPLQYHVICKNRGCLYHFIFNPSK